MCCSALDYESCVELQEKLAAGTVYQQLNAYAATVVGLKHAQQALAEHLHRRATGECDAASEGTRTEGFRGPRQRALCGSRVGCTWLG